MKLKRGLRLAHSQDMVGANAVNKLAVLDGVVERAENNICPLVFERLKIRPNIVYCFEKRPLSRSTAVTHHCIVLQLGILLGLFRYCPWGGSLQVTSPNHCFASKISRNAEEGGGWSSLELLILSL